MVILAYVCSFGLRPEFPPFLGVAICNLQTRIGLMLFTGLPKEGWEDYFYTSVEEITSPEKALARWAKR